MGRLSYILLAAGIALGAWHFISDAEVDWSPGKLAPDEPLQTPLDGTAPFVRDSFTVTPRAKISAQVRVLSKERYWLGEWADASPVDFAVGWGPMSDSTILADMRISQSNRFYYWSTDEFPLPRQTIERSAANWHMVPSSDAIKRDLGRVRKGDIVKIAGSLVDLESPTHANVKTSLTRDDTGAGACEVIWVESIEVLYR